MGGISLFNAAQSGIQALTNGVGTTVGTDGTSVDLAMTTGNGTVIGADETSIDLGGTLIKKTQVLSGGFGLTLGGDTPGVTPAMVLGATGAATLESGSQTVPGAGTAFDMDGDFIHMQRADDLGNFQSININEQATPGQMLVTDEVNQKGLETAADYSANFGPNSYVTMAWVMANFQPI